jgi:hypothetical protein
MAEQGKKVLGGVAGVVAPKDRLNFLSPKNERDDAITGIHGGGDPTPGGLLGAKLPDLFKNGSVFSKPRDMAIRWRMRSCHDPEH